MSVTCSNQVVVAAGSSPFSSMAMFSMNRTGAGPVPVFFSGRGVDRLAGWGADCGSVAGADQGDALGDVEGLPVLVGVPGGAGTGSGPHAGDDHSLAGSLGSGDGVHPDIAGELLRGFFVVAVRESRFIVSFPFAWGL